MLDECVSERTLGAMIGLSESREMRGILNLGNIESLGKTEMDC